VMGNMFLIQPQNTKTILRQCLESQDNAILITSRSGYILYCNTSLKDLVGYDDSELLKSHISTILKKRASESARIKAKLYRKSKINEELEFVDKRGEIKQLTCSVHRIEDTDNRFAMILYKGLLGDEIGRERKVLAAFIESIIENTFECMLLTDERGVITFANNNVKRLMGFSKNEILGQNVADHYYGGKDEARKVMALLREKGVLERYRTLVKRKEDGYVPVRIASVLIRDDDGQEHGTLALLEDLSQEELLRKQIERQKEFAKEILNIIDLCIIAVDKDLNVITFNRKASELIGYNEGEVIGKNFLDVLVLEAHRGPLESHLRQLMNGDRFQEAAIEIPVVNKRGEESQISWTDSSFMDESGRVIGVIRFGQDLTEQRRLRECLKESEKLALIGKFSAMIAHEIRNPLNSVEIHFGLLARSLGKLPKQNQAYCVRKSEVVKQELKKVDKLLGDFLQLSAPVKLEKERRDIHKVIRNAWSTLPSAKRKKVVLKRTLSPAERCVLVDPLRMEQVFRNILQNSLDSMSDMGTITIETEVNSAGNVCIIRVRDTGKGIEARDPVQIFDAFYSTKHSGIGLGLAIVKQIVEAHGGEVKVDSSINSGTTFTVTVPL
jgi:PAS domain S-box-containing protein